MQRLRREKKKNNPEVYEREKEKERQRYHRRKAQSKIKQIHELTPRQQRNKKKSWKISSKKYREKIKQGKRAVTQHIDENTPPPTPEPRPLPASCQSIMGRKKIKKDRSKVHRDNKRLKSKLLKVETKLSKYKTRYYRLKQEMKKNKKDSPMTKVNTLVKGCLLR